MKMTRAETLKEIAIASGHPNSPGHFFSVIILTNTIKLIAKSFVSNNNY